MTTEEFAQALQRWGSDLTTWPCAERGAADATLFRSAEARALLAAAAPRRPVMPAPAAPVRRRHALRWAALAVAATAGFAAGALLGEPGPGADPVLNLAFASGDIFDVR